MPQSADEARNRVENYASPRSRHKQIYGVPPGDMAKRPGMNTRPPTAQTRNVQISTNTLTPGATMNISEEEMMDWGKSSKMSKKQVDAAVGEGGPKNANDLVVSNLNDTNINPLQQQKEGEHNTFDVNQAINGTISRVIPDYNNTMLSQFLAPTMVDVSCQTDHTVLSQENLQHKAILELNKAFELRVRELRKIQNQQISKMMEREEKEKLRWEGMYLQILKRLLNQVGNDKFGVPLIASPEGTALDLCNHLVKCKELQKRIMNDEPYSDGPNMIRA